MRSRPLECLGDRPSSRRTRRPTAYTPGKTVPGAIKSPATRPYGPLPMSGPRSSGRVTINRYPDNGYVELKDRLAKTWTTSISRPSTLRGLRFGQPVPAADPDHLRPSATRCCSAGAVSRSTRCRSAPQAPPRPGAVDRPHLRPRRDARRGHRPDSADLRVQPQQPDRHRGRPRALARFVEAVPSTS